MRTIKVTIASGAPFNCGGECTLVQNADSLTLSRPDDGNPAAPDIGVVVLNLDGSESTIGQSNGGHFTANAKWDGDRLVITRDITPTHSVTQVLSVEERNLTVVTKFGKDDAPVTMTYVKR